MIRFKSPKGSLVHLVITLFTCVRFQGESRIRWIDPNMRVFNSRTGGIGSSHFHPFVLCLLPRPSTSENIVGRASVAGPHCPSPVEQAPSSPALHRLPTTAAALARAPLRCPLSRASPQSCRQQPLAPNHSHDDLALLRRHPMSRRSIAPCLVAALPRRPLCYCVVSPTMPIGGYASARQAPPPRAEQAWRRRSGEHYVAMAACEIARGK